VNPRAEPLAEDVLVVDAGADHRLTDEADLHAFSRRPSAAVSEGGGVEADRGGGCEVQRLGRAVDRHRDRAVVVGPGRLGDM